MGSVTLYGPALSLCPKWEGVQCDSPAQSTAACKLRPKSWSSQLSFQGSSGSCSVPLESISLGSAPWSHPLQRLQPEMGSPGPRAMNEAVPLPGARVHRDHARGDHCKAEGDGRESC